METRATEVKTLLNLIKKVKGNLTMKDYNNAVKVVYGDREYLDMIVKLFSSKKDK